MAVPKQKKSRSKVKSRRGTQKLKTTQSVACSKCGSPRLPHVVCKVCGTYKNREVLDMEKRKKRKERKLKAAEEEAEE